MTLHIGQSVIATLTRHARSEFPNECCGILVARCATPPAHVDRALPAANIAKADSHTSYQIDWRALLSASRIGRGRYGEVVGFYHSHPDNSPTPSLRDYELAWVGYHYLIVTLTESVGSRLTCWRIPRLRAAFGRETIVPTQQCRPSRPCLRQRSGGPADVHDALTGSRGLRIFSSTK